MPGGASNHCGRGHSEWRQREDGKTICVVCERNRMRRVAALPPVPSTRRVRDRHPRETLLKVSNAPLRERYLERRAAGKVTTSTIARKLGWMRNPDQGRAARYHVAPLPDTSRVMKTLGLLDVHDHRGSSRRQTIGYELAVELCHLLEMDPHEAGV